MRVGFGMLKSMTGFGRKKWENDLREIAVEIKSVNHRYLDINIKTPRIYGFLDDIVKTEISKFITRGKLDVYVSVKNKDGSDVKIQPNYSVIDGYLSAFDSISKRFALKNDITVRTVATLPDTLDLEKEDVDTSLLAMEVTQVLRVAAEEFEEMRSREGENLCADILNRAHIIEQMTTAVEIRSPICEQQYREKIALRMTEILGATDITEARILAEAAIFADKISVTEEIVRLKSHLSQLNKMIKSAQPIGRKLDFLVQELNREANTIGSKANDSEIAGIVIEMKSEIEKIREQVQNLE